MLLVCRELLLLVFVLAISYLAMADDKKKSSAVLLLDFS
jgi:hypothetical protein